MSNIYFRNREYRMPEVFRLVHCATNECLMFVGNITETNRTQYCLGIGRVKKIEKGEEFDVVKMSFGEKTWREIIVRDNHARRQIYTLKINQFAWFYGKRRLYDWKNKTKTVLYALGFQGWYVPKNLDIKQFDETQLNKLSSESKNEIDNIEKLLDEEDK